jgi:hypothetical protein
MKYATCHPDRPARAKGLCKACYNTQNRNNLRNGIRVRLKPEDVPPLLAYKQEFLDRIMAGWEKKLEDPAFVTDMVQAIFHTKKTIEGVFTA